MLIEEKRVRVADRLLHNLLTKEREACQIWTIGASRLLPRANAEAAKNRRYRDSRFSATVTMRDHHWPQDRQWSPGRRPGMDSAIMVAVKGRLADKPVRRLR